MHGFWSLSNSKRSSQILRLSERGKSAKKNKLLIPSHQHSSWRRGWLVRNSFLLSLLQQVHSSWPILSSSALAASVPVFWTLRKEQAALVYFFVLLGTQWGLPAICHTCCFQFSYWLHAAQWSFLKWYLSRNSAPCEEVSLFQLSLSLKQGQSLGLCLPGFVKQTYKTK